MCVWCVHMLGCMLGGLTGSVFTDVAQKGADKVWLHGGGGGGGTSGKLVTD